MPAPGTEKWSELLGIDAASIAQQTLEKEFRKKEADAIAQEVADSDNDVNVKHEDAFKAAKESLNFLAAMAMPTVFQYLYPKLFLAAWQLMTDAVGKVRDFTQLVLGIPRGFGKTTLVKLFILFCILFTNKKFILVNSAIQDLAENILADVCDMLNEKNISKVFGDWKIGLEKDTLNLKKFAFRGRTIILAAMGAGGSLRGLNLKNERPDVMIFEDVQTRECADSKVQSDTLERWMVGTAMKAKSPHGCFFLFVGNMYPTPYSILRKLKKNPKWTKFICGGILADGTSLWEELQPIQQLLSELDNDVEMGHEDIFAAEVLNDENAKLNTKVKLEKINEWPYNNELDRPQGKFIIIDPATKKKNADAITISYFEVYDGTSAIADIDEGSYSPMETIKHAIFLALKYRCNLIAVEATAYQSTLLFWFEHVCKELDIAGFEFVELHTGGYSKNSRITNGIKMMSKGELRVHPRCRGAVINQLSAWNPLKRDNIDGILDTIAYAPACLETYGHLMTIEGEITSIEYDQARVQNGSQGNLSYLPSTYKH
jgi:hypothetical protein